MDADISRLVLGVVSGFGFVGAIKLAATWFEPARLGLVIGLTQALGMLGGAIGTQSMAVFYQDFGWRPTLYNFSLILLGLSVAIAIFVRNGPLNQTNDKTAQNVPSLMDNIKTVFTHPITWVNAIYAGLIFAPIEFLGEVWGSQLIQTIHNISQLEASKIASFVFYGWLIGGPLAGQISSWVGRKPVMIVSAFCGAVISSCILFFPYASSTGIMATCFLLGLTNGGLVAAYTVASELHSKHATGLSAGLTNMLSVLIGAIMHPVIGRFIDWHWDGQLNAAGDPIYSAADFQLAFMVMPICAVCAFILSFFMKETLVKK